MHYFQQYCTPQYLNKNLCKYKQNYIKITFDMSSDTQHLSFLTCTHDDPWSQSSLSATHAYCSRESNQVITVFIRVTTAQLGLKIS